MAVETETKENKALIVIGGAFNYVEQEQKAIDDHDPNPFLRSAKIIQRLAQLSYSEVNKKIYRPLSELTPESELVVPRITGVFNIEHAYEGVRKEILSKVDKHPKDTKLYLAGFSMGGPLAVRFSTEYPELVEGTTSIAGAHLGSWLPGFGEILFRSFLEETADKRSVQGVDAVPINFVGSRTDTIVRPISALPDTTLIPYTSRDNQYIAGNGNPLLNNLITHHTRVASDRVTLQVCRDMLEPAA